ncbi:hypothetical protein WICPIJ_004501 [Wickerhamomyces pijperi]|uniref:Uncharacterized protein n=1 Tax=Wickerhamomyces pijperi TaxID=599730 RepID=A0A9P8TMU9_WICPI|nr:hypothetical protein WICPIJ_004501 [Wickerhamomyces pijperi]
MSSQHLIEHNWDQTGKILDSGGVNNTDVEPVSFENDTSVGLNVSMTGFDQFPSEQTQISPYSPTLQTSLVSGLTMTTCVHTGTIPESCRRITLNELNLVGSTTEMRPSLRASVSTTAKGLRRTQQVVEYMWQHQGKHQQSHFAGIQDRWYDGHRLDEENVAATGRTTDEELFEEAELPVVFLIVGSMLVTVNLDEDDGAESFETDLNLTLAKTDDCFNLLQRKLATPGIPDFMVLGNASGLTIRTQYGRISWNLVRTAKALEARLSNSVISTAPVTSLGMANGDSSKMTGRYSLLIRVSNAAASLILLCGM